MTWKINTETGELYDPDENLRATLDTQPLQIPDDVQAWAASEFRQLNMSDLTTDDLADFAELWVGDIETTDT